MANWEGHTLIMGRTGTGKTYHAVYKRLPEAADKGAVFYFNGGHDELLFEYAVNVTGRDSVTDILAALRKKRVVIYTPSIRLKVAASELSYWRNVCMSQERPMSFFVDEAPRYAPQGSIDTPLHLLATGGRRWGIEATFICQRVADLSKTVATQCANWVIFAHSTIDTNYLRQRGIDLSGEELTRLDREKHAYIVKHA